MASPTQVIIAILSDEEEALLLQQDQQMRQQQRRPQQRRVVVEDRNEERRNDGGSDDDDDDDCFILDRDPDEPIRIQNNGPDDELLIVAEKGEAAGDELSESRFQKFDTTVGCPKKGKEAGERSKPILEEAIADKKSVESNATM